MIYENGQKKLALLEEGLKIGDSKDVFLSSGNGEGSPSLLEAQQPFFRINKKLTHSILNTMPYDHHEESNYMSTILLLAFLRYLDRHFFKKAHTKIAIDLKPIPILEILKEANILQNYSKLNRIKLFKKYMIKEGGPNGWKIDYEQNLIKTYEPLSYKKFFSFAYRQGKLYKDIMLKETQLKGYTRLPVEFLTLVRNCSPRREPWKIILAIYLTQRYLGSKKNQAADITFEQILNHSNILKFYWKEAQKNHNQTRFQREIKKFTFSYFKELEKEKIPKYSKEEEENE